MPRESAAHDVPFPTRAHRVAAWAIPSFVPTTPDNPERERSEAAWALFDRWAMPFLPLFSNRDPVTRGGHRIWHQRVPGAEGQPHDVTCGAGHFLHVDCGAEVAQASSAVVRATPLTPAVAALPAAPAHPVA